jgi:hypothetical protein
MLLGVDASDFAVDAGVVVFFEKHGARLVLVTSIRKL